MLIKKKNEKTAPFDWLWCVICRVTSCVFCPIRWWKMLYVAWRGRSIGFYYAWPEICSYCTLYWLRAEVILADNCATLWAEQSLFLAPLPSLTRPDSPFLHFPFNLYICPFSSPLPSSLSPTSSPIFLSSVTSERPLSDLSPSDGKWHTAHTGAQANVRLMGAYIVQQEREQKRRRAGLVGAITHTYTQHISTCRSLTDTRILQPDTSDGLDALSRRREAPCFLPVRWESKGEKRERVRETHTHTHTHTGGWIACTHSTWCKAIQ